MQFAISFLLFPLVMACPNQQPELPPSDRYILALSYASSRFFQNLSIHLNKEEKSVVLSPISTHMILTLTSDGARGRTAHELKSALNIEDMNPEPGMIYRQLIQDWDSVKDVELLLANALYVKPGLQIRPLYRSMAEHCYNASVENIDMNATGGPEKPINDYIAEQTKDNIQDMLRRGSITRDTALLNINTLFINSTWYKQFDPQRTQKANFTKMDGSKVEVDMMEDIREVPYKKDDVNRVEVLELQFKNRRFSMYIVLPEELDGVKRLEVMMMQLSQFQEQLFQNLTCQRMRVEIPKSRIESEFRLDDALRQLGIRDPFDRNEADLSGIADGRLYISRVQQKAVIEVMETGTVAAVSTVVQILLDSAENPPSQFKADRPYMFFLCDREAHQILYQGRYNG